MASLDILVPRPGSSAGRLIHPGSGVVAPALAGPSSGPRLRDCWFEGNLGGRAENLGEFAQRLACAAGRQAAHYPTIARATFLAGELTVVGRYDATRQVVTAVTNPELLVAWAKEPIERICGVALPLGRIGWSDGAVAVSGSGSRLLCEARGVVVAYRLRCGQVLLFDLIDHCADVLAHDDPRLPHWLPEPLDPGLADYVFGEGGQSPFPEI